MAAASYRIVVAASGSRGDVQPYIAVALELRARGHSVSVATEKRMKSLVEEFGLEYREIGGDPTGILWEPTAQDVLKNGSMLKLISLTKDWEAKFNKQDILNSYVSACRGAEVIVAAPLTMTQTFCVSEYLHCAWVPLILGPTVATNEFPLYIMASMFWCCPFFNKLSYWIAFRMLWAGEKGPINEWRTRSLALPPMTNPNGLAGILDDIKPPVIVACSPIISGPLGRVPRDYPSNIHMKGFVFVPSTEESAIDARLVEFVKNDPKSGSTGKTRPIIYLGFGSMPCPNPTDLVRVAVETCEMSNCRAVLVAGWSQLDSFECQLWLEPAVNSGALFLTKAAPHDWLFPKMACIVHHCGVGTMAAALRSGVPQVPCPVMLDQPHNAQTVVRLNCAPGVLPFGKLTSRGLAQLVNEILNNNERGTIIRRAAKVCGETIRRESDTSKEQYAVIIEEYAAEVATTRAANVRGGEDRRGAETNSSLLG